MRQDTLLNPCYGRSSRSRGISPAFVFAPFSIRIAFIRFKWNYYSEGSVRNDKLRSDKQLTLRNLNTFFISPPPPRLSRARLSRLENVTGPKF